MKTKWIEDKSDAESGALGQPYLNEAWVWTTWGPSGQLLGVTSVSIMTHSQAIAELVKLASIQIGSLAAGVPIVKVCGTYAPTGYVKTPVTICLYGNANNTIVQGSLPSWLQSCMAAAFATYGGPNAQWAKLIQCLDSYYGSLPPALPVSTPFVPFIPFTFTPQVPVVPFRPGFTTTFVETTTTTIPRPPILRPSPSIQFTFASGPMRWLGQTCQDLKNHLAVLQQQRSDLSQDLTQASAEYNEFVKQGNLEAAQAAQTFVYEIKTNISNLDAQVVQTKAEIAACEANSAPPPPQTQCVNDHPDCGAAGFICVNGDCVPGCRNDGDCGAGFTCANKDANGIGQCQPAVRKAGMGGGWAIFALAAAALAAVAFGARPGLDEA